MKKLIFVAIFFMFAIDSSAKIFVPDGNDGFRLRNDIPGSLSTFGICKSLGYEKEMFYSFMNLDNDSDIYQVCFKIFTEEIICVFTQDNVQEITEKDISKFLKDNDFDFNREYSIFDRESDLSDGIKYGTLGIKFLSDVMKFEYNMNETDAMVISEKFGYKLFFKNGVLYKFESADGLNRWSRQWKERFPYQYNKYYEKSKNYWVDDEKKILNDINLQAQSWAHIPSNFMEVISLFEDNDGYINYRIIDACIYIQKMNLREFKDISYGDYKYIGEILIKDKTLFRYKHSHWMLDFSKEGILVSAKLDDNK